MLDTILENTKQDSIHIHVVPDKMVSCLESKFGGEFYLPIDSSVPVGVDGREMEFLAQINFSQMPTMPGFPNQGLLQFFLCTNEEEMEEMDAGEFAVDGHFLVRYYPAVENTQFVHREQTIENRWQMEKLTGGMKFDKVKETATLSIGGEGFLTDLEARQVLEELQYEQLEEMGYDLSECSDTDRFCVDFGNWGCKVGGHPSIRQGDIRLEEEEYEAYTTLLFQYDLTTKEELEADTFSFFIKPEDLAACCFENVLLCWHNCY